jgi:hypothetical protein
MKCAHRLTFPLALSMDPPVFSVFRPCPSLRRAGIATSISFSNVRPPMQRDVNG